MKPSHLYVQNDDGWTEVAEVKDVQLTEAKPQAPPNTPSLINIGEFRAMIHKGTCCGVPNWYAKFPDFGDAGCCDWGMHDTYNEAVLCARLRAKEGFVVDPA